jgi:hypothetical protein
VEDEHRSNFFFLSGLQFGRTVPHILLLILVVKSLFSLIHYY